MPAWEGWRAHAALELVEMAARRHVAPLVQRTGDVIDIATSLAFGRALGDPTRRRRWARIRAKLLVGRLPRRLPVDERVPPLDPVPRMRTGPSAGTICSACDEPIPRGAIMVDYTYRDGAVVRFHDDCERLWEQERRLVRPT